MMICDYNENSLVDCIQFIETFEIFNGGQKILINQYDSKFNEIKLKLEDVFMSARLMPAFGVSLHNETLNELENGEWLQINFGKILVKNGLPFKALLFKSEECQGFNLIRLNNGKYEGRCLYLDLEKTVDLSYIIM